MPKWYYTKKEIKENPSVLLGMDPGIESRYRREGARFIMELGTAMNLSLQSTMATAVVFFHRFYMKHTFQDFPRYPTACACLFLAGKVEETPKKCRDMIDNAKKILNEPKFSQQFGPDIRTQFEEVMTLERILLQSIKFDLQLEHPYKYLLKYAQSLKGDKARLERMVQMAWNFVNDSLCTTLCLQWEPEIIAIALMYLACKLSKFEVHDWNARQSDHFRWWDQYVEDMSIEVLEDICHQVLDFYSQVKSPDTGSGSGTPTNHASNVSNKTESTTSLHPNNGIVSKITSPHAPSPVPPPPQAHIVSSNDPMSYNSPAKPGGVTAVRNYHSTSLPGSPNFGQLQQQQPYHQGRNIGIPAPVPSPYSAPPPPPVPMMPNSGAAYNYVGGPMLHPPPPTMLQHLHQPPPPLPSHFHSQPPPSVPPPPPHQPNQPPPPPV